MKNLFMKTRNTKIGFISMLQIVCLAFTLNATSHPSGLHFNPKGMELTFAENKCQVKDYSGRINKKVLFLAQSENMKYLFRKDGISLQLTKPTQISEFGATNQQNRTNSGLGYNRLEISWEGMNKGADIYGAEEFNFNFMKTSTPEKSKECQIKNFRKLYYTEIYPGIDLRYCDLDNRLKFDILVQPGFDYKEIKMRIDSAREVYVNKNGQLVISTKDGEVFKDAPVVTQEGKPLQAKWTVQNQLVSLDILYFDRTKEINIQTTLFYKGNEEVKL